MSESRVFGGGVRGRRDLRRVGDRAGLGGGGGPRRQDVRAGAAIQGSPGRSSGRQLMDLDRLAESTRVTWWNQRLLQPPRFIEIRTSLYTHESSRTWGSR
jgi:hypothetical protein